MITRSHCLKKRKGGREGGSKADQQGENDRVLLGKKGRKEGKT